MRISSIKKTAKNRLSGNWGKAILTLVVFGVLEGLIHLLLNGPVNQHYTGSIFLDLDQQDSIPGVIQSVIEIISAILNTLLGYGLLVYFIKLIRDEEKSISDLFFYFKSGHQFIRGIIVGFLVTLFTLLWTLLLIVPGIIKSIAYSQVGYILKDHPEMGALDAITLSRRMMDGYKWKLFLLWLSFIGWGLLIIITFGLALFYVAPYFSATQAQFYEEVKEAYEGKKETI
ncbi:hypothetical protein CN514_20255 [Bacillus sp. AFS001701]|uniref:DUF975 family protein n=1 Tax=Bacillus sp. AFS001701 TaxID=2033480 RepID=UPI000BF7C832|nr:DUF975 family protein [Bacillus sp. AFS001701]PET47002.1 hypothetical protein CN514_20255 [Bacillus sp. AFS001701]